MKRQTGSSCSDPIANLLKLLGKMKIFVIYNPLKGPPRFGQLKRTLSPITQQMLTKQLRKMERDKWINRKIYEVVPSKVEYSLTKFGRLWAQSWIRGVKWGGKTKKINPSLI